MSTLRFFTNGNGGLKAYLIDEKDIFRIQAAASREESEQAKEFSPLLERMKIMERRNQDTLARFTFFGDLLQDQGNISTMQKVYIRNGKTPIPTPLPDNLEELGLHP
jgi:hypothetical protein